MDTLDGSPIFFPDPAAASLGGVEMAGVRPARFTVETVKVGPLPATDPLAERLTLVSTSVERRAGDRRWGTHEKAGLNRNRRNGMDRRSPAPREVLISIYLVSPNPAAETGLRSGHIMVRYEDPNGETFELNVRGPHDEHQLAQAIRAVQDLFNGKKPTPAGGFDRVKL